MFQITCLYTSDSIYIAKQSTIPLFYYDIHILLCKDNAFPMKTIYHFVPLISIYILYYSLRALLYKPYFTISNIIYFTIKERA